MSKGKSYDTLRKDKVGARMDCQNFGCVLDWKDYKEIGASRHRVHGDIISRV